MRTRLKLCVFALGAILAVSLNAAELPQYAQHKHMGVATCANSVCHSVKLLEKDSNVLQNEYQTWLLHDRHAGAYKTLLSRESKLIAEKLGFPSAAEAAICLDCHADNVAPEKRGVEFHITDGVGCEACHGGAERYISSHTLMPYDGARNIADGLFPTANLVHRTRLCLSCHVGNEQKMANHDIMGAGHPRLGFELDTFSVRQPLHHLVDEDYLRRKGNDSNLNRVLIGAAVQAWQAAVNLTGKLIDTPPAHPEIALYDCHSCHHSLTDIRAKQRPSTAGLAPGMVRLNDSSFLLLSALTGAINRDLQSNIAQAIKNLHRASSRSRSEVKTAAVKLKSLAEQSLSEFQRGQINAASKTQMVQEVINLGIRGEYYDYVSAEQAVMVMDAISTSLPPNPRLAELIDKAFQLTGNEETYQPGQFQTILRRYKQ